MRRTALALTSLALLVGFTAACGDNDDKVDTQGTSSASSAEPNENNSTPADPESDGPIESPTAPPSDLLPSDDQSPTPRTGPTAKYCTNVDKADAAQDMAALKPAVKGLLATLPKTAGAEAKAGLTYLNAEVQAAKDFDEMSDKLAKATPTQQKQVTAYGEYEDKICK